MVFDCVLNLYFSDYIFYMLMGHLRSLFEIPVCVFHQFFYGIFLFLDVLKVCWILMGFFIVTDILSQFSGVSFPPL